MTQEEYKRKLIQQIQINKSKVFFDEDQRKDFMLSRFNVNSTKDMKIDQLILFLKFCKRQINDIPILQIVPGKELLTQAQKEKIRVMWKHKAKNTSEEALLSFASKIGKYKLTSLDNLLKGKATNLIVAITHLK